MNKGPFRLGRNFFLIAGLFLLLSAFIIYQYRAAIFNPPVTITSPKEKAVITSPTIVVKGNTQPDSTVSINGESAAVDDEGKFEKQIVLFSGEGTLKIEVVNRFGRKTEVVRHIDVKAAY